jgi:hypothetical protein
MRPLRHRVFANEGVKLRFTFLRFIDILIKNTEVKMFSELFHIVPLLIGLIPIIFAILVFFAVNHLHKIPRMLESIENIEKHLEFLVAEKKKMDEKEQSLSMD